ncbi:restriction endonuclease subunit S [Elizabethkingia anophelis]|nr:restriction endonuclease subunit S [Elizabethkingia anophelis]MCT3822442.1 restriction endonuclease subunit S [Elizabethkingia anophelis]MCT3928793.1 restriction endonuclease subunit S [Elizabethkingia anophelis]MCT4075919.1 restriction endonuclease subunit S [Elizabethkingia anophelis]MCT4078562.1 restriction endonuclease subunit S [Elizabethkingia anophelis]
MEGLEVNEVNLSYLKNNFRIDAEFYSKAGITLENMLLSKGATPISDITKLYDGPFGSDFHSEGYTSEGVPIIRMQNIFENGLFNFNNLELISVKDANRLSKHTAYPGEVVTTKIGFLGYTTVLPNKYDRYIFRREITRLKILGRNLNPYYLATFLNSKFGRQQFYRYSSGTSRDRVLLINQREILFPILSNVFQESTKKLLLNVYHKNEQSEEKYAEAENLLLRTLGSQDFQSSTEAVNIKSLKESFLSSGRLDAEYYQPKYEDYINMIGNNSLGFGRLEDVCNLKDKNFNLKDEINYKYIELSNIGKSGEITGYTIDLGKELPSRARRLINTGDVIISSIEGSLKSCALVTEQYDKAICSTGFYVINSNKINSETLLVLFKSELMQSILKQNCSGTILTAINKNEFLNIPIPYIENKIQKQIAQLLKESFALKTESEKLLETANRAVEIAIEENEEMALEYINENS